MSSNPSSCSCVQVTYELEKEWWHARGRNFKFGAQVEVAQPSPRAPCNNLAARGVAGGTQGPSIMESDSLYYNGISSCYVHAGLIVFH